MIGRGPSGPGPSGPGLTGGGLLVLVVAWLWPLPHLGLPPFTTHMTMHMAVVAVAAPLLALGVAGTRADLVVRRPAWMAAIPASLVELMIVWVWHAPALHELARDHLALKALEQLSFLGAGVWLWLSALGGRPAQRRERATAGVTALLLTAMHMTLLGALLVVAPRVLYPCVRLCGGVDALTDQHIGGAIMLLVGGAAYLAGGVGLTADVIARRRRA